jgi:hypothetical protein
MSGLNHYKLFNLGENYNHEQLEVGYNRKLDEIKASNLSEIDKELYLEQLDRYYEQARSELRRRYLQEERQRSNRYFRPTYYDPFSVFREMENRINKFMNFDLPDYWEGGHRQVNQYQHIEHRLDDGSYLVQHREAKNVNGHENIVDQSYINKLDGSREYISKEQAQNILSNTKSKNLLK